MVTHAYNLSTQTLAGGLPREPGQPRVKLCLKQTNKIEESRS